MPLDPILRRRDVEAITGLGRSTIYKMISDGQFPKPIQLGARAVGWPESAIRAWLALRGNAQPDHASSDPASGKTAGRI